MSENTASLPPEEGSGSKRAADGERPQRRHGLLRRWVVRPAIWVFVLIVVLLGGIWRAVHTDFARERARSFLAARMSAALGHPVTLGHLDFRLLPLEATLENLVVAGSRPADPPLATVRRLHVEGEVGGWARPVVHLTEVDVDGANIFLLSREEKPAKRKLPAIVAPGAALSPANLALEVDALSVRDSGIRFSEQRVDIDLDARGVAASLLGVGPSALQGVVDAREISFRRENAAPYPFSFSGRARVTPQRLELLQASIEGTDLHVRTSGFVDWSQALRLALSGPVDGELTMLSRLGLVEEGRIRGAVHGDVTFEWGESGFRFRGPVRSNRAFFFGHTLEALAGRLDGTAQGLEVRVEDSRYARGTVTGSFALPFDSSKGPARLDVHASGAAVDDVLAEFQLPFDNIGATADGDFRFVFSLRDALSGRAEGRFRLSDASVGGKLPGHGEVRLALEKGKLDLERIRFETASGALDATGEVELAGEGGHVDFVLTDAEAGAWLPELSFLDASRGALWLPTSGRGDIRGRVALGASVAAALELHLTEVRAPGIVADRVEGNLTASAREIDPIALDLSAATGASIHLGGRVALASDARATDLTLESRNWPVEASGAWIGVGLPISGPASGRLHLGGAAGALTGSAAVSIEPASVAGVAFDRVDGELRFDGSRVEISRVRAVAPAGSLVASGSYRFADGAVEGHLRGEGLQLAREPAATLLAGRVGGRLDLAATLGGTKSAPTAHFDGALSALSFSGRDLAFEGGGKVTANLAGGRLDAALDLPRLLSIRGGGPWQPSAGDLRFEVSSPSVAALLSAAGVENADGLSGSVAGTVAVSRGGDRTSLRIELPRLDLAWKERKLSALEPIVARLDRESLHIDSFYLSEPGTENELFVGGTVGFASDPTLALHAQGSLSPEWISPWTRGVDLRGRIDALLNIGGTVAHPRPNGEAELTGGRYIPPRLPHTADHLVAEIWLAPEAIVLERLNGDFAGGTVAMTGRIDTPAAEAVSYRFQASGRKLNLRYPEGWLLGGDADLTLASTDAGRSVRGTVDLDRIFYLQDIRITLPQLVERFLSRARVQVEETDDFASTTALNIAISGPKAVRVRNNLADLRGSASLSLRGTLANPVLFGQVESEPGGTVTYNGNTYFIDRGLLNFTNPTRIDPQLDLVARTKIDQYDVSLEIGGTLERPTTTFSSDPPLPDLDVLGLLTSGSAPSTTLGSTGSSAAVAPSPQLESSSNSAEQLLYGQAASLISERVGQLFRFDKLRIEPLTTSGNASTARVTVGKRLSKKLYVTYSIDPSSTAEQILQVEWRLSDRLVLLLTQNGNESYAVDARWESRF